MKFCASMCKMTSGKKSSVGKNGHSTNNNGDSALDFAKKDKG